MIRRVAVVLMAAGYVGADMGVGLYDNGLDLLLCVY